MSFLYLPCVWGQDLIICLLGLRAKGQKVGRERIKNYPSPINMTGDTLQE
jgi:hypothetical protein